MEEMKARHAGFFESRTWHKVLWTKGVYEGKFDLFTDEDVEKNRGKMEIISTFCAEKCATGVPFSFGNSTEAQVDEWISRNRKQP